MKFLDNFIENVQQFLFGNDCPVNSVKAKLTNATGRKPRDSHVLTQDQIDEIRLTWANKGEFDLKTFIDLKNCMNEKYGINKSRSVYCKVVHKNFTYADK